jgi:hypothetical protein
MLRSLVARLCMFACFSVCFANPSLAQTGLYQRLIVNPTPVANEAFGGVIATLPNGNYVLGGRSTDDADANLYLYSGTSGQPIRALVFPVAIKRIDAITTTPVGLIVVGAVEKAAPNRQVVYLYNSVGDYVRQISDPVGNAGEAFGQSLAATLEGNIIIGNSMGGTQKAGVAYIFSSSGTLLLTLNNPDPIAGDFFGNAVAVTKTGNAVVASQFKNENGLNGYGAVYIFSAQTGVLIRKISNPISRANDLFGSSLAATPYLSSINYLAIGAPNAGPEGAKYGAVYVFNADTGGLQLNLQHPDSTTPYQNIGSTFALSKDGRLIVGAPGKKINNQYNHGGIYIYDFLGSPAITIDNPDLSSLASFGGSLGVLPNGDFLVGATRYKANNSDLAGTGAVYQFSRTAFASSSSISISSAANLSASSSSVVSAALSSAASNSIAMTSSSTSFVASSAAFSSVTNSGASSHAYSPGNFDLITNPSPVAGERFGQLITTLPNGNYVLASGGNLTVQNASVHVYSSVTRNVLFTLQIPIEISKVNVVATTQSGKIIVGVTRKASPYDSLVYIFSGQNGALLKTITAPVAGENSAFAQDSIISANGQILIGARTAGSSQAGAVYVYSEDGVLLKTLSHPSPVANNSFGMALAVSPTGEVIVGAPYRFEGGAAAAGTVYVFSGQTWNLLREIKNPTPASSEQFGAEIKVLPNGDIVVGAPWAKVDGLSAGEIYVFSGSNGSLIRTLREPTPNAIDQFGLSIAITPDGDIVSSSATEKIDGIWAGSVYIYSSETGALLQTLAHPNPKSSDYFGIEVVIAPKGELLVGAYAVDADSSVPAITDAGAVYVYNFVLSTPPVINQFVASPQFINQGQNTTLSWKVKGALGVNIDNVNLVPGSTSVTLKPLVSTTYILKAQNALGEVQQAVTVSVTIQDTDTDGMSDYWEALYGLNPANNDAELDPDSDGLSNLEEYLLQTHPKNADTDADGIPDGFEVANGLDPLMAADATADLDSDGFNNYYEYLAGTDLNLNTDYPLPQTVTSFSSLDLPCESASCYALVSWSINQYSTACVFDQTGVKQVCAAAGSIKVLKDPQYQKSYKILEYPIASAQEIGTVVINNSRVNSWGRITPVSNGPCTLNSSTGECIKNTSVNYSRKTGEQHVTMWRVNPDSGVREEVQRFYNGAVFDNYSLIAPNQKGYVYELREGISSEGILLHAYVSWKNEKATPPPALNATPQNCSVNEEHETCTVQVHWDKASMGNAAQYCLMNGAELIKCTTDNTVNVTVGIRPLHLQLRTANSVNVNVLSDVFVKAVVSASFKLNAPSCVPTYGNSCLTSVSWSAQESINPCLYKDGQLWVCAKAGRLDIPVSTSGTSFSLRNGSVYASSTELITTLAKVEDNWLSLSSESCDIRYPDTQCRINVAWAVRPAESACIYQNGEELFCGVNGNKEVFLNPGAHEFSLRQNGSVVRTMATNVKVLPWGKLTFPAFTKYGETVQRPGGKNCLLAPGQTYCTVRMDAIFQNVSRLNYVTLWRKYEEQWQLFNKKAIGELINGVFQNEYDFVTNEPHEYRLTWRSDGSAPSPNDFLLDQAIIFGVAAPNYEYSLQAPKNYCYYAEGESTCKVKVSWITDDVRFTSLCLEGQGINGLPLCKPSGITTGKWQGEIEVDVSTAGKKLLLRDNNLLLTYRELNLYAIKGLDFINVSECSYTIAGVCSVTVIWNATAAKNCIYAEALSAPVACTNNTNGNGMVTFDVTDATGGNFYLAADTDGMIERLTSFNVHYDTPVVVPPKTVDSFDVATDVTDKNFLLKWGAAEGAIYHLEYRGSAELETLFNKSWSPIGAVASGSDTFAFSMEDVAALTYLQWRIKACNSLGECGSWQHSRIKVNHLNTSSSLVSLLAPADNSVVSYIDGDDICFSWIPDSNAKLHNITISDTPEFSDKRWLKPVNDQQETCWNRGDGWSKAGLYSGELSNSLEYGKIYHWRIAVMNPDDSFSFSQTRKFVLRKDSPTINVSADIYAKKFTINWDDLGVVSYQLEFRGAEMETELSAAVWQNEASYSNTGRHLDVSMVAKSAYRYLQWRVRACDASMNCTQWDSSNIKVNQYSARFSEVQLISPELNQVINSGGDYDQPCFKWSADPQAVDYVIAVSPSSEFPDKRWTRWTGSLTEVCWDDEKGWQREGIYSDELPQTLNKRGSVYYWRITSIYADASISFSPVGVFAVNDFADPIAALLSPLPKNTNSIKLGKTLPLQMAVYDRFMRAWTTADGQAPAISYYVNGNLYGDVTQSTGEVIYWSPPAVGRYEIYAVADMRDGRLLESRHAYVDVVDMIAPSVNLTVSGSFVELQSQYLVATVNDPDMQVESVAFRVNGEVIGAMKVNPPYTTTWRPDAPGNYQLDVVLRNRNGEEVYSTRKNIAINPLENINEGSIESSVLIEAANQNLRLVNMNLADALVVNPANSNRISYNKFDTLLLNRPLKIINRSDMHDNGIVPQLIVLDADQIDLNSSIEIVGEPADLLIINAAGSNAIRCKNCGFVNVERAALAVATPDSPFSSEMTQVGQLQTRTEGVIDIDNLQASGAVSLEIIADKVIAKGHVNTQQYARQSTEVNPRNNMVEPVLDFITIPDVDAVVVGSGGVSLLQGNLAVSYETLELGNTVAGTGVMDLQATISSGSINIFATDVIQLSGNLSTRSSHRAAQIYRGQLRAQEEKIQLKTIARAAAAPSLRIHGRVLSDADVYMIGHSGEIKSDGGIHAAVVKVELIDQLLNQGYIHSYVRATLENPASDLVGIVIGAGTVDNRGEIQSMFNNAVGESSETFPDGEITIASVNDIYNRFGGLIKARKVNVVSEKGKIRNGSLYAFDGTAVGGKESTTAIEIAPHETSRLSTHTSLTFSTSEPAVNNVTAVIIGDEITLNAAQSVENINPYTEPYTSEAVEISAVTIEAENRANDVQIEALKKLSIASGTYVLNSSAKLGVSESQSGNLLSIKAPAIRNERYYSRMIMESFSDHEKVQGQSNVEINNWARGVQSRYGFYSPPGYIYSFAKAEFDFGATGDGLLNNISYVDLYGDLSVFGQGKITTRGISLEKLAYESGSTKIVSLSECIYHQGGRTCSVPTSTYNRTPEGKLLKQSPDNTLFAVNGEISAPANVFGARNDQGLTVLRQEVIAQYKEEQKKAAIDKHKASGTPYIDSRCDVSSHDKETESQIVIYQHFYSNNSNIKCFHQRAYGEDRDPSKGDPPSTSDNIFAYKNITDLVNEKILLMGNTLNQQVDSYCTWRGTEQVTGSCK